MKSDFLTTIGEVAEVFDGPHATPKKVDYGPYFLSISSLENGNLDLSKSAHLSEEDFNKWTRRVTPKVGDVLFSYETRLGDAALMPQNVIACLGRRMGLLRPIRNKVIPEYLLYAYLSPAFQEVIRSKTIHGATVDRIALKELPNFPIRIPPIDEQRKVVNVLNSINSKLELNRQTNQTLEQIAQAIFKSWFFDFDPVRAKISAREAFIQQHPEVTEEAIRAAAGTEGDTLAHAGAKACELAAICAISGKTPEQLNQLNPETQQQVKTTAALFPDALVDSELGEVPEGWEYKPLSKLVELIGGGTPKKSEDNYWGGVIPWFSVKDAPSDGDVFVVDTEQKITELGLNRSSTKLLPVGTTIISARGTVGRLALVGREMAMNQSCYGVKGANGIGPYLNYFNLKEAVTELQQNTHGAVFDTITRDTFDTVSLVEPCMELKKKFDVLVEPLLQRIMSNLLELVVLCDTRDILLPKLLSGELHIVDAITADMVKGVANG